MLRQDGFQRVMLPLVATPVLVAVAGAALRIALGRPEGGLLPPGELAIQLAVGWLLAAVIRPLPRAVAAHAVVIASVALAQYLKVAHMGTPVRLHDLAAFPELARVIGPWRLALLALPPAVLAALVAGARTWRRTPAVFSAALGITLAAGLAAAPRTMVALIDGGAEPNPWSPTTTMLSAGPTAVLLRDAARLAAEPLTPPSAAEVRAALAAAPDPAPATGGVTRRPLVMVVLESFWDPALLTAAGLGDDPFAPDFRPLWQAAGESTALSGEFGGATANPELEVLCGLPTSLVLPGVAFASSLVNRVPCLPALLAGQGWRAAAFHPNRRGFWNRGEAYPRVGFPRFVSLKGFQLDDLNGPYLSDASLYRQAWEELRPGPDGPPPFAYVLTYTGHWDYPLEPDRRPYLYTTTSSVPEVARYASSVHYSAAELTGFIDRVLADQPEALVVALGDHLPVLGANVAAYAESDLFGEWVPSFTPRQLRTLTSVPLLVVDGPRGPLPVGTLAQFELPSLILELLGLDVPAWMWAALPPPGWHIRTRPEGMLVLDPEGGERFCRSSGESAACAVAFDWLNRARVIARDLAFGRQHALDPATMAP